MIKNKLIIIVHSNEKENINYALSMSATASAIERKVVLFFSGKTINNLLNEESLKLKNIRYKFTFSNNNELLLANIELGTSFLVCSGALHTNKIDKKNLRKDINWKITGLTEILADSKNQIVFI